ncbi:putative ABC transport system permease protein [Mumia flava]|uniref:Putative ABC transport system permease protein n=1 Tax=Mumia flava TaxID=1348852 RepID=A0A0B2B6Q9_9ACTN|nr:FtsX-like permease family protein [Mumia flava]PJJ57681.1 putative ABC transport system permease protein [Mumia flava]
MLRVTLRNLVARKVRLLMSAFAIVLGIAFVAGTLIFTDTMNKSFEGIVNGSTPYVTVQPIGAGGWDSPVGESRTIPASVVDDLDALPEVARADGSVASQGLTLVGEDGKLVGGFGPPTLSFSYDDAPAMTGEPAVTVVDGRAPTADGEVALDEASAENGGYQIGDTVDLVSTGEPPRLEAELVGIVEFGGGSMAGASLVLWDSTYAQELFLDGADAYSTVALTPAEGVSQEELAEAARAVVPPGVVAVTGDDVAEQTEDLIGQILGFLTTILLVFAGIAIVVGTFLIVNTFSILVAQRSRELALLRALGASRRQVSRSVLLEALVVGVVGSTIGVLLGIGLAMLLSALFATFGLDVTDTPLQIQGRTWVVGYVVGIAVTLIAAYLPARRASRVPPVAAMRDDVALPESSIRVRMMIGAAMVVAGAGGIWLGVSGSGAWYVGGGALLVLIGVALMSPLLSHPVLAVLGGLFRPFGMVGRMSTQNAMRNPRRTAATASALMIGLALVTTMSILGSSVNASVDEGVRKEFTTDLLLSNPVGAPFSASIADQVREIDGVGEVAEIQFVYGQGDGFATTVVTSGDPQQILGMFEIDSDVSDIGPGEVAVMETVAESDGLAVGDTVTIPLASGPAELEVVGTYAESNVISGYLTSFDFVEQANVKREDSLVGVNAAEGVDPDTIEEPARDVVADLPTVIVQTQEEFIESQRDQVNQILMLINALLGLAIVIAALGIVNTLALSVIERTREVGLLRAVGMSRRQLRRMVRLEAVAIAVLGAVLGIAMGLVFGVVLQRVLEDEGVTELSIPYGTLVAYVLIAAVVGVLAAVIPAFRASRLNVLQAIATE